MILISDSRTALIALLFYYLSGNILKKIVKSGYFTYLIPISSYVFIYMYTYILPKYNYLDKLVMQYTGKNLFSGRNIMWKTLIDKIIKDGNLYLGYGTDALTTNYLPVSYSIHNQYLEIFFKYGIFGSLLFWFFIISFLNILFRNKKEKICYIAYRIFLSYLIVQNFELNLINNNFPLVFCFWSLMAYSISIGLNKKRNSKVKGRNHERNKYNYTSL